MVLGPANAAGSSAAVIGQSTPAAVTETSVVLSAPTPPAASPGAGASAPDISLPVASFASPAGSSALFVSDFVPAQAPSHTATATAPSLHFAASAPQLPAGIIGPADFAGSSAATSFTLNPAGGAGLSMLPVASVFTADSGSVIGGMGDGYLVSSSELPFMQDVVAGDTPVYVASDETPWIFVSDFGGDWFFV